jgi:hypothetical protein
MIPLLANQTLQHRLAIFFIGLPAKAVLVGKVAVVNVFRVGVGRVFVGCGEGAVGEFGGAAVAAEMPFGVEFQELVVAVALCVHIGEDGDTRQRPCLNFRPKKRTEIEHE